MNHSNNISLSTIKHVFFIGIGGIGMSALARYFNSIGATVSGYDKTETSLTKTLEQEGIHIHYVDDIALLPKQINMVVYTPAIPSDHRQWLHLSQLDIPVLKRAQVLGILSRNTRTIAVAGSHGKTTVSAMIAHILKHTGYGCSAFLGGISIDYQSNYLQGDPNTIVVEADEFDRSFLTLHPTIAVLTSVDTDHLDIYKSRAHIENAFLEFIRQINDKGTLVIQKQVPILPRVQSIAMHSYGLLTKADTIVQRYNIDKGKYFFEVDGVSFNLSLGGRHNMENALAAISVAKILKIDLFKVSEALSIFKGIKRRFEILFNDSKYVYIDDYAHHPSELDVVIRSVKELFPSKPITLAFQPHLYSRTHDFYREFAEALSLVDSVLLLDIYPAREAPIEGVSSQLIFDYVETSNKKRVDKEAVLAQAKVMKEGIFMTVGAGDIDKLVFPLKQIFENKT